MGTGSHLDALAVLLGVLGLVLAGVAADAEVPTGQTEQPASEFLQSVIGRIGGKPEPTPAKDLAKPVADLKAALERVSETMAAAGVNLASDGPQPGEVVINGPPFVLAPHEEPSGSELSEVVHGEGPPPQPIDAPPLSKHELSAVYQAVANQGLKLDLAAVQGGYIPPGSSLGSSLGAPGPQAAQADAGNPAAGGNSGYYYYFFPIKDLGEQQQGLQPLPLQQQQQQPQQHLGGGGGSAAGGGGGSAAGGGGGGGGGGASDDDAMGMMASLGDMGAAGDAQKSVEPLFMAMSGFIGMALMFVLSVLFLPKWGALRSRGVTALKHAPDELASLTKLVVQSIEGKDCSERIACEVGRAVRTMHLGNKPLRVLEIILPPHLSKQIGHIRKAVKKAEKCNFIPCKYPLWYTSTTLKPPYKLHPKLTTPRPASRSTPRTRPVTRVKLILGKNNNNNNNKNHENNGLDSTTNTSNNNKNSDRHGHDTKNNRNTNRDRIGPDAKNSNKDTKNNNKSSDRIGQDAKINTKKNGDKHGHHDGRRKVARTTTTTTAAPLPPLPVFAPVVHLPHLPQLPYLPPVA